ncbi:hypothetical protein XU18_3232 [Perkinsela sp. CCAP 1560/4]|nr:hypothetical protein XU18_3232 [Perkinsela sp. CCAP 1560/4]|eukprot:KNH05787.1 hypothetical protein XU18_3232 [Perkinsela sp. CCAP 1560/4]
MLRLAVTLLAIPHFGTFDGMADRATDTLQNQAMWALISMPSIQKAFFYTPCKWTGVECIRNRVTAIEWPVPKNPHWKLNVSWIPPTIVTIIAQFHMATGLHTRSLPSGMRLCRITSCGLYGTVNLQCLPKALEEIDLSSNRLHGTVHLTNLPKKLRVIILSNNDITAIVVKHDCLPKTLHSVMLIPRKGGMLRL